MFYEAVGNYVSPILTYTSDNSAISAISAISAFDFALFFEELFFNLIPSSLLLMVHWAAMVDSVYRIDETGNLVSCDSPVPSTSASGTDTNVSSESSQLPENGYERPTEKSETTVKPMNDIVASIKTPCHCARHLSTSGDFERRTGATRCLQRRENMGSECAIKEKVESSGGFSALPKDATFSSGQAQFCSLVRAVLEASHRSGGIILFDEATSGLKAAVEYDQIVVMDDGKVIHFGSPAEAMRNSELLGF
ncbi:ATP-binding cassette transporter [Penicillium cf. viridicatum]|uniref:ATP-binding cassette transporter n=1 Tax=Penicillium cf. viridicatum TaxID=2972119 RepID=A0A9W9IPG9_9EURO|nr:ATP-binding cassette transporter [Penicillium cf. viridicatum]